MTQRVQSCLTNKFSHSASRALLKPVALTQIPQFNLRVRQTRDINYEYENERKKYHKEFNANRRVMREEFWDLQTQIENKTFTDHLRERFLK